VRTALRVLLARLRRRPLELEGPQRRRFWLYPDGTLLPAMAGGEKTDEEIAAEEEAKRLADEEAAAEKQREEEEENSPKPILEGDLDKERAERLIQNERDRAAKRLKKAQDDADAAKAEAAKLRQEKETEQERVTREAGESKAEAERQRANAERLTIDAAIRDAAADADVPAKTIKRLVRLVDREHITVDTNDEVDGATEAVEAFLTEFPEFKGKPAVEPEDGDPPDPEPAGGNPARKKNLPKELTAEQARKLAKEEPEKFHELLDAGKLEGALAGK
jgi:fused signal recognition particle receptor